METKPVPGYPITLLTTRKCQKTNGPRFSYSLWTQIFYGCNFKYIIINNILPLFLDFIFFNQEFHYFLKMVTCCVKFCKNRSVKTKQCVPQVKYFRPPANNRLFNKNGKLFQGCKEKSNMFVFARNISTTVILWIQIG